MMVVMIPNLIGALVMVTKGLEQGLEDLEKKTNHSTVEITEKSPKDSMTLAITQTLMKRHQITL